MSTLKKALIDARESAFDFDAKVRFQDVDAAGIVYYPRIQSYFHDAYVAFLEHHGIDLAKTLSRGDWAAPIKHAEADFLSPLRFGDRFTTQVVGAKVEGSQVSVGFRIKVGERLCAVGASVHVFVDLERFSRIELPELAKKAFASCPALDF